jgi:hypothetical protein
MLRAGVFPRTAIWVFLAGMAVGLLAEAFEQSLTGQVPVAADLMPVLGFMVAGVGMVLLGLAARRLADPAGAASATSSLD